MNRLVFFLVSLVATSLASAQIFQPPIEEALEAEHGVYSVLEQSLGLADTERAKAYDNFALPAAEILDGISWTGIYGKPLPGAISDVDFLVEIWRDSSGLPDILTGPVVVKQFEDGSDVGEPNNLTVTPSGDTSPGGGPGFHYSGKLPPLELTPGSYWVSVLAKITYETPPPSPDPLWQWHWGDGPDDGMFQQLPPFDSNLPPLGTFHANRDMAFRLDFKPAPVPESSTLVSWLLLGTCGIGLFCWKALARESAEQAT